MKKQQAMVINKDSELHYRCEFLHNYTFESVHKGVVVPRNVIDDVN